jgi:hypothetical protein
VSWSAGQACCKVELPSLTFGLHQGGADMLNASESAKPQDHALKPYQKPTLIKGPMLTSVTAAPTKVSGIGSDGSPG